MTEFERQVERLKLQPEQWKNSKPLRNWCEKNRLERFIPEELLLQYGLTLYESDFYTIEKEGFNYLLDFPVRLP